MREGDLARRLPIRVSPLEDEPLESWVEAYADAFQGPPCGTLGTPATRCAAGALCLEDVSSSRRDDTYPHCESDRRVTGVHPTDGPGLPRSDACGASRRRQPRRINSPLPMVPDVPCGTRSALEGVVASCPCRCLPQARLLVGGRLPRLPSAPATRANVQPGSPAWPLRRQESRRLRISERNRGDLWDLFDQSAGGVSERTAPRSPTSAARFDSCSGRRCRARREDSRCHLDRADKSAQSFQGWIGFRGHGRA